MGSKYAKIPAGNYTGFNFICLGRSKVHEAEDERTCQTENGEDRHRLPETSRCFLPMATKTQNDNSW